MEERLNILLLVLAMVVGAAVGQSEIVATMNQQLDNLNQQTNAIRSFNQAASDLQNSVVTMSQQVSDLENTPDPLVNDRQRVNELSQQFSEIQQSIPTAEQLASEMSSLEQEITNLQTMLQDQADFRAAITSLNSQLETLREAVEDTEYIYELVANITADVNDLQDPEVRNSANQVHLRSMVWPQGRYTLLMPRYGCPRNDFNFWSSGARTHWTSTVDNQNQNVTDDHMPLDLFTVVDGNYMATLHFCTHREAEPGIVGWPKGTYCIFRKSSACLSGFVPGDITFDDEDPVSGPTRNSMTGVLPDGDFGDNSRYRFCCREDGDPDWEMDLPYDEPFYLFRHNGRCQLVSGMDVTNDFIVLDTANDNPDTGKTNADRIGRVVPDGGINNVRLELCYYEKSIFEDADLGEGSDEDEEEGEEEGGDDDENDGE